MLGSGTRAGLRFEVVSSNPNNIHVLRCVRTEKEQPIDHGSQTSSAWRRKEEDVVVVVLAVVRSCELAQTCELANFSV